MQEFGTSRRIRVAFIVGPIVLALALFFGMQALGTSARASGELSQATATTTPIVPAATVAATTAPVSTAAASSSTAAATSAASAVTATAAAGLPTTGTGGLLSQHSQGNSVVPWLPFIALLVLAGGFVSYRVWHER